MSALCDCVSRAPNLRDSYLAANYAQLGQEARAEAAEILRTQPDFTITDTSRRIMGFKSTWDDKHWFEGLRKAGVLE